MLTAMVFHGVWDDDGGIIGPNGLLLVMSWVVLSALAILVAVRVYAMTVPPERAYLRAVLAPEAAAGVLTDEEVDALAGDRHARKAYRKAPARPSQSRRLVLEAAHDLADELARTAGHDDERVRFARQEVSRVRQE